MGKAVFPGLWCGLKGRSRPGDFWDLRTSPGLDSSSSEEEKGRVSVCSFSPAN